MRGDVELAAQNKALLPQGLRICKVHRGAPIPLSEFYANERKVGRQAGYVIYSGECRACKAAEYRAKHGDAVDGERLSPKALRALNAELFHVGLRVCRTHQGHPLPLTAEHFYRTPHGTGFETRCKTCFKADVERRYKERMATDAEFRARKRAWARAWKHRHPEYCRAAEVARLPRRKRARLAKARALSKVRP